MSAALPYASPGFFGPSQAAWIAKRARMALSRGLLKPHHFAVLEPLLWDARPRGSDRVEITYSGLQRITGRCRQTIADAIAAFEQLGLVRRIKRKTLTLWTNGGRKWRQEPNEYVFCCESAAPTEYPKEVIQIHSVTASQAEIRTAQAVLDQRRRAMEARLLGKVARGGSGAS